MAIMTNHVQMAALTLKKEITIERRKISGMATDQEETSSDTRFRWR